MLNTVIADEDTLQEIKNAATEAKKKVLDYYPTSNKQMYTIVIVMDLRLKLQYFKKNKWKSPFISQVKAEVTEIWNSTYKNNNLDIESSDNIDDDLLSYIFRKQKTESDELVSYLKEPVISNKTDVLS
ncbi:ribonuclease H-like domain-containing protein [Rhizophagus clarus]|nr:ribonuclease H-like domain-containing protein [Rhizophagus clarus]